MNVFLINIYERNSYLTVKVDNLSYTLKLDESLDSGVLTIPRSTKQSLFQRFARVDIYISDGTTNQTKTWLIYDTKVEIESKYGTERYNHILSIIEPIKWLEKFQCGSLGYTQPIDENVTQKTLLDYVERLMDLVPFVQYDKISSTRLFRLDLTTKNYIKNVIARQVFIEKKNLREHLIELFKMINAIPRIEYDYGWKLKADFVNNRLLPITIGAGDIDYISEAQGETFAQAIESHHENTIPEETTFESTITDFVSFRNNDIILGDSNLQLFTSHPISELKNFTLLAYESGGSGLEEYNLNKFIFELNVYNALDFKGSDYGVPEENTKELAVYWTYKSNVIQGFSEQFLELAIFETTAIDRILSYLGVEGLKTEIVFKVEYEPYFEKTRSKQYREDIAPYSLNYDMIDFESSKNINLSEGLNDAFDITENMYGVIQRTGVDTVMFSRKHYNLADIYNIGDYTTDGYIVTKVEVIPYTAHFIARYEASKNWNRISQFIKLPTEFRPYEITRQGADRSVKRNIIFNLCYVELSSSENTNSLTDLGDNIANIRTAFMETFKTGTYQKSFGVLKMKIDNNDFGVMRPVASYSEKNTLRWKADFTDTKLANKNITENGWTTELIQGGVFYTNDDGSIEFLNLSLSNSVWQFLFTNYENENALITGSQLTQATLETIRAMSNRFPYIDDNINVVVLKDPSHTAFDIFKYVDPNNAYDTLADLISFEPIGTEGVLYLVRDTYIIYEWSDTESDYVYSDVAVAVKSDFVYDFPTYKIDKDGSEILGIEIAMPILPQYDEINKFIVGESLVSDNVLLRPRDTSKTLYWYGMSSSMTKFNSKKIPSTATQVSTLSDLDVSSNVITVPSAVYSNYNTYALGDSERNLYFAVNQVDFSGTKTELTAVYFNFLWQRKQPPYSIPPVNYYEVSIDLEDYLLSEYGIIQNEYIYVNIVLSDTLIADYTVLTQEIEKADIALRDYLLGEYGLIKQDIEIVDIVLRDYLNAQYGIIKQDLYSVNISLKDVLNANYGLFKGDLAWETSDSSYYASATTKYTLTKDNDGYPLPDEYDYAVDDALRVIIYNLQLSNSIEYGGAGTQINISDVLATQEPITSASNTETVETFFANLDSTNYAIFVAGNMTDTVIKITDKNANITYWKPDYGYDYYKLVNEIV